MKVKTSELQDKALDWAVMQCEEFVEDVFEPSEYWGDGGPIIEREKIRLNCGDGTWGVAEGVWEAAHPRNIYVSFGPTPLVAAMRCYVASVLGGEVDIPEELL